MNGYHVLRTANSYVVHADGCPDAGSTDIHDNRIFASSDIVDYAFEQALVGLGFSSDHAYHTPMWYSDLVETLVLNTQTAMIHHQCVIASGTMNGQTPSVYADGAEKTLLYVSEIVGEPFRYFAVTDQYEIGVMSAAQLSTTYTK